jgi:hypothetical protein
VRMHGDRSDQKDEQRPEELSAESLEQLRRDVRELIARKRVPRRSAPPSSGTLTRAWPTSRRAGSMRARRSLPSSWARGSLSPRVWRG